MTIKGKYFIQTTNNQIHNALDKRLGYEIISEWTLCYVIFERKITATSARHYLRSIVGSKEFANCPS